ncbi:rhodanese-like domain-containing protein [Streptomyces sp. ADMS]|uniref:rhodanese-like domain-containing protein n=1 Tax=Streptomyces sp. ADMS TaxID=3071415 RepID=UPI00296E57F2|nr:rhodanese-like domain-containing protein [Streptomyces sp. ADMS]MDW4906730.1 rhodanese-like domain-containing protein [Streptomyces sp. ADMS]
MFLFRRSQPRISVEQARSRTSGETPDAVLLDVREQPEWNAGHAPGALHIPLSKLVSGSALPDGASGRALVVICRSGHRSQQAAKLLTQRGEQAVDVKGGMNAWAADGYPVSDERGNSGRIA